MRQHATLAGVDIFVACVVGVCYRMSKCVVKLRLSNVGLEPVDFLEGRVGVEGDAVGTEADDLA